MDVESNFFLTPSLAVTGTLITIVVVIVGFVLVLTIFIIGTV